MTPNPHAPVNYARNTKTRETLFFASGEPVRLPPSKDGAPVDESAWCVWRLPDKFSRFRLIGETPTMYEERLQRIAKGLN